MKHISLFLGAFLLALCSVAVNAQGTCAMIWQAATQDTQFGTHLFYGAAWSRATLDDAKAAARTAIAKNITGLSIFKLQGAGTEPFGDGAIEPIASGCDNPHGAVAGKLKADWQTNVPLGPGIYDVITAKLAATTSDAVAGAMNECSGMRGPGNTDEVCSLLVQW